MKRNNTRCVPESRSYRQDTSRGTCPEQNNIQYNAYGKESMPYRRKIMRNNTLWRKLGLTTALAATFGLVSSGVFLSVNGIAQSTAAQQTAIEATAQAGSAAAGEDTKNMLYNEADSVDPTQTDTGEIESTEKANNADTNTSGGTMTVAEVAANSMPAMVAITNTSVEDVQSYFGGSYGDFSSIFGDEFGDIFGNGNGQGQPYEAVSMGSGVIIGETDDQIIIATNQHVISSSKELSVAFIDDTAASATVLGEDSTTDLAVIAVNKADLSEDTISAIRVIEIGSSDELLVGEEVVAIGNALGYGQSVSSGIVSAMHRTLESYDGSREGTDDGLIQTDAAINPGNSGGALLNMKGELIGINSAKYADTEVEGMGYAIPITSAQPILTALQNGEAVQTAPDAETNTNSVRLGISCTGITEENSEYYGIPAGVYVKEVEQGSAAANAGLQEGDIITAIDDTQVTSVEDLTNALATYSIGDSAELTVSREVSYPDIFAENGQSAEYQSGKTTVTFGSDEAQRTSLNEQ